MRSLIRVVSLASLATLFGGTTAHAMVNHQQPNLPLLASFVQAGGGPDHFDAATAFATLTGAEQQNEHDRLVSLYGADAVESFTSILTFAVDADLSDAEQRNVVLPDASPAPADVKALRTALFSAGVSPGGKWDVGYFLEALITHPTHVVVMHAIDAKFGAGRNSRFHVVLNQFIQDLPSLNDQP